MLSEKLVKIDVFLQKWSPNEFVMYVMSVAHSEKIERRSKKSNRRSEVITKAPKRHQYLPNQGTCMHLGTGFGVLHVPWGTELHLQHGVFHGFGNRFWLHGVLHWILDDFNVISWLSEPREMCFHRGETPIFYENEFPMFGIDFDRNLTSKSLRFQTQNGLKS